MTVRTLPERTSAAPATPVEALTRPETPSAPVDAPLTGPNIDAAVRMGMQLHAAGNLEAAINVYRRVTASHAEHANVLHLMGVAYHQLGDLDTAVETLESAVAANPGCAKAWSDLGETYRNLQRFDEALAALEQAITLDETNHAATCNYAHALLQRGRHADAILAYECTVELGFEDTHLRTAQGVAFKQLDRLDDAAAVFERALELDPTNPEPQYLLAVVRGESLPTAPRAYVESLFDRYAPGYDTHLVELLEYAGHEVLFAAVERVGLPDAGAWRIADLGCGTGLCGAKFKPFARTLIGVDLSRAMIAEAWTKNIYDELVHDDLLAALEPERGPHDLIIAGDVFIYVGDLDAATAAAARSLPTGGLFAFTCERHDGEGFVLRTSSRFAHSESYLRSLADRHGFEVMTLEETVVRREQAQAIAGQVAVLRKR